MDGTKVTSDPSTYNDPKNENPGMVTSDSLGAESIKGGGSFAANSDARGPMDQPSYSTNTNNRDISGATVLNAAPDAEARETSREWSESAQLKAGSQLAQESSSGSSTGGGGGGTSTYASTTAGGVSSSGGDGSSDLDTGNAATASSGGSAKPKGSNIQEGGFDSDAPNASFTTDIGGKDDPGRVALGNMQESNTPYAGGAGGRQEQVTQDGQYDALDETSA